MVDRRGQPGGLSDGSRRSQRSGDLRKCAERFACRRDARKRFSYNSKNPPKEVTQTTTGLPPLQGGPSFLSLTGGLRCASTSGYSLAPCQGATPFVLAAFHLFSLSPFLTVHLLTFS